MSNAGLDPRAPDFTAIFSQLECLSLQKASSQGPVSNRLGSWLSASSQAATFLPSSLALNVILSIKPVSLLLLRDSIWSLAPTMQGTGAPLLVIQLTLLCISFHNML